MKKTEQKIITLEPKEILAAIMCMTAFEIELARKHDIQKEIKDSIKSATKKLLSLLDIPRQKKMKELIKVTKKKILKQESST